MGRPVWPPQIPAVILLLLVSYRIVRLLSIPLAIPVLRGEFDVTAWGGVRVCRC
jgi:hypothetical protein